MEKEFRVFLFFKLLTVQRVEWVTHLTNRFWHTAVWFAYGNTHIPTCHPSLKLFFSSLFCEDVTHVFYTTPLTRECIQNALEHVYFHWAMVGTCAQVPAWRAQGVLARSACSEASRGALHHKWPPGYYVGVQWEAQCKSNGWPGCCNPCLIIVLFTLLGSVGFKINYNWGGKNKEACFNVSWLVVTLWL